MALLLVRNAGQREKRPVPSEWGGMAATAALCEAAQTLKVCVRLARLALPAMALPSVQRDLWGRTLARSVPPVRAAPDVSSGAARSTTTPTPQHITRSGSRPDPCG